MKRSRLNADPEKVREFLRRGRQKGLTREPRKPKAMRTPTHAAVTAAQEAWFGAARRGSCAACNRSAPMVVVEGHHVLEKQRLRTEGVPEVERWDLRLMLPLCGSCHELVTGSSVRIARSLVLEKAPLAIDWAEEHDLGWLFDREYPT